MGGGTDAQRQGSRGPRMRRHVQTHFRLRDRFGVRFRRLQRPAKSRRGFASQSSRRHFRLLRGSSVDGGKGRRRSGESYAGFSTDSKRSFAHSLALVAWLGFEGAYNREKAAVIL